MPAEEAVAALEAVPGGLTETEAADRRAEFGPNTLPRPKPQSTLVIYIRQFKNPLIYLLLAATAVSLSIGAFSDALFIFAVLQINATIGTIQERKAELSSHALDRMIPNTVIVRRDGRRGQIDSTELVPGDMVILDAGARVPADVRLIGVYEAHVDESLLTGESVPVYKDAAQVLPELTVPGDRRNMLFAGTTVTNGRAEGVVTQTGAHTEIGRIASALKTERPAPPPLLVRLKRFTRAIGAIVVAAIAALAAVQLVQGMPLGETALLAIALAVSAIPEGLPVAITIALSVGAARMAARNVIVRALPAVEGLGACTLIASDKTGTLTCNELTVKRLYLPGIGELEVAGEGYLPVGDVTLFGRPIADDVAERAGRLAQAGVLCNDAMLQMAEDGVRFIGDTMDVAFLVLARKLGYAEDELIARCPRHGAIPFDSAARYAASFNADGNDIVVSVKGAAEAVLPMCGGVDRATALDEGAAIAAAGYKVLAVAQGRIVAPTRDSHGPQDLADLDFLGFVGIIDPVRPEVPDAVGQCRAAGVDVRMVTGDHPETARAIATELGIATGAEALTGSELAEIAADPEELDIAIASAKIFARVEPLQKLTIVESLQRQGEFVAVTGDGANDAPALRVAHLGVAMGESGTDVARGAADLILTDDNFTSIVGGIEEGRIAYDNVRKVVYLLISTGAAEIVVFFLSLFAGLPLPLFAVQLLWLNLVTNGIQDVALAFEKGEPGVLTRPPRPPRQRIFDRRMIQEVVISGVFIGVVAFAFFWWALRHGWNEFDARNALLLLMVLFENVHVFNCRSETRSAFRVPFGANPFVVIAVVVAQACHIGAMYTPGLSDVLAIRPVSGETWFQTLFLAVMLLIVMEGYKAFVGRSSATGGTRAFG
jgi:Ca2+-transporting ATPase